MHISALLLASLLPLCLGAASSATQPDLYETIKQREAIFFDTIDTKQWDRLGESLTQDFVHDSRPLGPEHGRLIVGLQQVIESSPEVFGTSLTAHTMSNAIIQPNPDATAANVSI